jgi:mannose-6-phosphate isomerase-like protein (cupin superfamily)
MSFDQPIVSSPATGLTFYVFGRRNIMHATAVQTGGAVGIWEAFPEPGMGVPLHQHSREDEVFRVLAGDFRFRCGSEEYLATTGATITLPRNVPHSFQNIGATSGHLLTMVIPGGFEQIFLDTEALGPEPSAADLAALDAKYGVVDV